MDRATGEPGARGRAYVPALGWDILTRLYDPLVRLTMPEERFRSRLLARSGLAPGARVLDLACGTGSLTVLAARRAPGARWSGVDGDRRVLAIASDKAARADARPVLVQGLAGALPFADTAFDRVLSSLFFHHLTSDQKPRALAEAYRVTAPGGEIHNADWGPPRGRYARAAFAIVRLVDGRSTTSDNVEGRIPAMIEAAGFRLLGTPERIATPFGTLELLSARKPATEEG